MGPLLLLHGALSDQRQFDSLIPLLDDTFDVMTLNFAGHGGTVSQNDFSIEEFAEQVVSFLDQQGIEKAHFFGYSMGGYVALYLAKHHPNRVDRIFTLGSKLVWDPESGQREAGYLVPENMEKKVPRFADQLKAIHHPNDWKKVVHQTADFLLRLGKEPSLSKEDYADIQHPILFAVGDQDLMALEDTLGVKSQIPNASLLVLPRTPHPFNRVDVTVLSTFVKKFFLETQNASVL